VKQVPRISAEEAARLVRDGAVLMAGGFGMTGNPVHLLHALAATGVKDLTYIGNNVGEVGLGGGRLLRNRQLRKAIGSFFTSNREAVAAAQSGALEVQLLPQGTLAEAIRAGGAGLGGFYTPTAHGTPIAGDADVRVLGGGARRSSSRRCAPTSPSSAPGRPTPPATWSTGAPSRTSTRRWPPPPIW
jgi:3-oxoacid CoA-transferase